MFVCDCDSRRAARRDHLAAGDRLLVASLLPECDPSHVASPASVVYAAPPPTAPFSGLNTSLGDSLQEDVTSKMQYQLATELGYHPCYHHHHHHHGDITYCRYLQAVCYIGIVYFEIIAMYGILIQVPAASRPPISGVGQQLEGISIDLLLII